MLNSLNLILIPLMSMTVLFVGTLLLSKMMNIGKMQKGTFISMCVASNSMMFGLPICLGLFGNQSVPYVIFYYIANTIFFWAILAPIIMKNGDKKPVSGIERLKNILNIPLVTIVFSIILLAINLPSPNLIVNVANYLSNMITPLGALVVGRILYETDYRNFKFNKSILAVLFMKFVVSPSMILLIANSLNLPLLATKVFIIQASMPPMMQTAMVTEAGEKDSKYAATILSISNILCLFLIPIYMWIINNFI